MQQQRPTHEVKVFLHMNLSYELIKHVKRHSCLCHLILTAEDQSMIRSMSLLTTELTYALSMLISAMLLTFCAMCTLCVCMVLRR